MWKILISPLLTLSKKFSIVLSLVGMLNRNSETQSQSSFVFQISLNLFKIQFSFSYVKT